MRGGIAALNGVAALVHEACHLEAVKLARGNHELPQSSSSGTTDSLGVEGRLDDGQVLQLQRQLIGFESLLEDWDIEVGSPEHNAHGAAQTTGVLVYEATHDLVIRHLDDVG